MASDGGEFQVIDLADERERIQKAERKAVLEPESAREVRSHLLTSQGCRPTAAEKESHSIREPAPRNKQRGDPIYGTGTRRQEGDHRRVRYPSR